MRKHRFFATAAESVIPTLKSLPVAALLVAGMAACSDDGLITGDKPTIDPVVQDNVTFGNDPTAQASRITFYGQPAVRAAEDENAFPAVPEIGQKLPTPEGPSYDTPNQAQQAIGEAKKTNYILTGGDGQIECYGGNVYITGTVNTHNINGSGTIYVMPEGKLVLKSGFNNQGAKIVAYGALEPDEGNLTLGANGQILVNGNFHVQGNLNVEGTVVVKDELKVDGKIQFKGSGQGQVKSKCIWVYAEGDHAVDMSGGGKLAVRSYLNCNSLYMGNSATVYMYPQSMAEVAGITAMTSNACSFKHYSSEDKTQASLVKTGKFHVEGGAVNPEYVASQFSTTNVYLNYGELYDCSPAFVEKFIPSAESCYIPKEGCNPGFGSESDITFDPIAKIEGPTHDHTYLSATCVQAAEGTGSDPNLAYVSYHLNTEYKDNNDPSIVGADGKKVHQGCLEVYEVTENGAQITNWLMNDDFDFNHLIVDGNTIYTVGDTKKYGATIGVTKYPFGKYELDSDGRKTVMAYYNLYKATAEESKGTSGNCIIKDGNDYFRIASYKGFQSFAVSDTAFEKQLDFIATSGSAKHVAKSNKYIVTLSLDKKEVSESEATVTVYSTWGQKVEEFKTPVIKPIDGKNVVTVVGESVFVALGENGVLKHNIGSKEEKTYKWNDDHQYPEGKRPCANGLYVDGEYVYVAYGAAGMVVLDRNTMGYKARYWRYIKDDKENVFEYSANYVQRVGNLIYIAWGRDGLEVVKMNVPVASAKK